MGKDRVVDKTVQPQTAGGITVGQATGRPANQLGVLPIGYYKGQAVFVDLDKLVNQPLVHAEQLNSLGKIDTRNQITLTIPSGTAVGVYGTVIELEVPSGEVWFLSQVELITPAQAGGIVLGNFRVSGWSDPDYAAGQKFWVNNQGQAAGGTYVAECYGCAPAFVALGDAIGTPLRLGPGAKLTLFGEVTTAALTADRTLTLNPYGWKGKQLVE